MAMKHLLMLPLLLATAPVMAQDYYQPGGTQQTACYETVYREEYVPGTKDNTGYVRTFRERVAVPCEDETPIRQSYDPRRQNEDTNSCIEGSVIGGLLGGGIGGAISRDSGRWIAVPTGAVLGGLIGCQVDGG
tara:strand:- start:938 stop:1336 length:399 start_codon:yes stop_codon:yes gene_type:complete